jgi:hypothetical protein
MRKLFLLLTLFILFKVNSQNDWAPLDNGTDGVVNDLIVYNNELYAAGEFSIVGGIVRPNIAKWNGNAWFTVGGPSSILNKKVDKMIIYNNELYALGKFTAAGTTTMNGIGKWNGTTWISVGFPISPAFGTTFGAAAVFNNELFVISCNGSSSNKVLKYNGTSWVTIGYSSSQYGVADLCVYNNELYASGNYTTTMPLAPSNNSGICKWNGSTWTDVGGLVVSPPINVTTMSVHNNELYVGGSFNTVGGVSVKDIAKYNGSSWSVANTGTIFQTVYSILSYSNNLYVGGPIFTGSGFNSVQKLSATSFVTVSPNNCLAENCGPGIVYALAIYNNELYVGGGFNQTSFTSPYTSMKNIAKLTSVVGINEENFSYKYSISPNPSTGQYTFEGLTDNCSIEVTDLTGRIIHKQQLSESDKSINLLGKTKGIYLYKLKTKENRVQQGKLILE